MNEITQNTEHKNTMLKAKQKKVHKKLFKEAILREYRENGAVGYTKLYSLFFAVFGYNPIGYQFSNILLSLGIKDLETICPRDKE